AGMVVEVKFDQVPLADPYEFPRHLAAKGPEGIVHPCIQALYDLSHLKLDDDFRSIVTRDGRRHRRGLRQDWVLLALGSCRWRGCGGTLVGCAGCSSEGSEEHKSASQCSNHTVTLHTVWLRQATSGRDHRVPFARYRGGKATLCQRASRRVQDK